MSSESEITESLLALEPRHDFESHYIKHLFCAARSHDGATLNKMLLPVLLTPNSGAQRATMTGPNFLHVGCGQATPGFMEFLAANGSKLNVAPTPGSEATDFCLRLTCGARVRSLVKCTHAHDADLTQLRTSDGATGLHIACENDDQQLVANLLSRGAEPNVRTRRGLFPVQIAGGGESVANIDRLVAYGAVYDVEMWKRYGSLKRGLRTATSSPVSTDDGSTNLHLACEVGNPEVIARLLQLGEKADQPQKDGMRPLIIAATYGHTRAVSTLLNHDRSIVNLTAGENYTALIAALRSGHFDTALLLLDHGALPLIYPRDEAPPAMTLLMFPESELGERLLAKLLETSDIKWRDQNGYGLLHFAARMGAKQYVQNLLQVHNAGLARYISTKAVTPLHCAVLGGDIDVVRMLLNAGRRFGFEVRDVVAEEYGTAMDIAQQLGADEIAHLLTQ